MNFDFNGNNNFRNSRGLSLNNNYVNDNYEDAFEHWLREIAKLLRQNDNAEKSRNERLTVNSCQQQCITLEDFLKQAAFALRDEFMGTVYQIENTLCVKLANNEVFCLKITKNSNPY